MFRGKFGREEKRKYEEVMSKQQKTPSRESPKLAHLGTPRSGRRRSGKLSQPFKSPFQGKKGLTSPSLSPEEEKSSLERKLKSLNEEIDLLQEEYDVSELKEHIEKLHEYNDIKDAGQLLIGKIAEIEGKTTKMLYTEFGLELED